MKKVIEECLSSTGSTWVSQSDLVAYCKKNKISYNKNQLKTNVRSGEVVCTIFYREHFFSIRKWHILENSICQKLVRLKKNGVKTPSYEWVEEKIKEAEAFLKIKLHVEQRNAVHTAVSNVFSIVTGGPGTGKTSVLIVVEYIFKAMGIELCYMAPTGKAAKRITESTGSKAYTMHKKMEIIDEYSIPKPLAERCIVIDESSMADMDITNKLLTAISSGCRLIWVGDIYQLPSVGAGSILRDFIGSGFIPTAQLEKTFRQLSDSNILNNIMKIKTGKMDFTVGKDFRIFKNLPATQVCDKMISIYLERVKEYGIENVALLTPYRVKGECCSNKMNNKIQNILNPGKPGKRQVLTKNWCLRMGDIVMQLENRAECVNGDVGRIINIDDYDRVTVLYADGEVVYKKKELGQLTLAYAMSVHKSQGSEYKAVVTCLLNEHKSMWQKNMPYTAVTRAKEVCDFFFDTKALTTALSTEASDLRTTMLAQKLTACKHGTVVI